MDLRELFDCYVQAHVKNFAPHGVFHLGRAGEELVVMHAAKSDVPLFLAISGLSVDEVIFLGRCTSVEVMHGDEGEPPVTLERQLLAGFKCSKSDSLELELVTAAITEDGVGPVETPPVPPAYADGDFLETVKKGFAEPSAMDYLRERAPTAPPPSRDSVDAIIVLTLMNMDCLINPVSDRLRCAVRALTGED